MNKISVAARLNTPGGVGWSGSGGGEGGGLRGRDGLELVRDRETAVARLHAAVTQSVAPRLM